MEPLTEQRPASHPKTPDGRYFVVRGRLWRATNPALPRDVEHGLVSELMAARRAVREAVGDTGEITLARNRVEAAKIALGERGEPWWDDGAPDFNRRLVKNTPYSDWFATLDG